MLQRYDFCRYRENLKVLFFVNFSKKYINKTSYSTFRTILRVDYLLSPKEIVYLHLHKQQVQLMLYLQGVKEELKRSKKWSKETNVHRKVVLR